MRALSNLICAMVILCAFPMVGLAKDKSLQQEVAASEKFPSLVSVHSLDVEFFTQAPGIEGQTPGSELAVTAVNRLKNNSVLPYKSPSDAVLRFSCESFGCTVVKAQIVRRSAGAGYNSPIIWEYSKSVFRWPQIPYYKLETADVANKIIDQLLEDIQSVKLVQESPATIPQAKVSPGRIEPVSLDKPTP